MIVQVDDAVAVQVGQLGCRLGGQPRAQLLNHAIPPRELVLTAYSAVQAQHHEQCRRKPCKSSVQGHVAPSKHVGSPDLLPESHILTVQCSVLRSHNFHEDDKPLSRLLLTDMMHVKHIRPAVLHLRSCDGVMLMYVNKSEISEERVPSDLSSCTRLEYKSRSLSESDSAPAC